jgi:hypothetical protein
MSGESTIISSILAKIYEEEILTSLLMNKFEEILDFDTE